MPRCARTFGFILILACAARAAGAQVLDPTVVEFTASSDHDKRSPDGVPFLTRYEFMLYAVGSSEPILVAPLGKPDPDAQGTIRVELSTILRPLPAPGAEYEVRVVAIGPGGSGTSAPSNEFSFQSICEASVSAVTRSFGASGGSANATVTAGSGCPWSAASNVSWLTFSAGGGANFGSGVVSFSAAANNSTTSRSGTLTIAGESFTVTQAAAACTFSLASSSASFGSSGGSGSVAVSAGAGCPWSVSGASSWIDVSGGGNGNGNGTVSYSVDANSSQSPRSVTLTVAGRPYTVNQAGISCTATISPGSASIDSDGGTGNISVTTGSGCSWSASSSTSWIDVTSGASGRGNGAVRFSVDPNAGTAVRTGTIIVAGKTFQVSELGVTCTYTVTAPNMPVAGAGGVVTFSVSTPAGCAWSASETSSWLAISGANNGSGTGVVRISVSPHRGTQIRSTTVIVAGRQMTLSQVRSQAPKAPTGFKIR